MPRIKQKLISYPKEIEDRVKKLRTRIIVTSDTAIIFQAINNLYEQTFENYKEVAKFKANNKQTPEEKARMHQELKDEKEKAAKESERQKKEAICNALEGEVTQENGHYVCTYYKFQETGGAVREVMQMPIKVPFDYLPEDAPQYQYEDLMGRKGDFAKETVKKLIKQGKLIK